MDIDREFEIRKELYSLDKEKIKIETKLINSFFEGVDSSKLELPLIYSQNQYYVQLKEDKKQINIELNKIKKYLSDKSYIIAMVRDNNKNALNSSSMIDLNNEVKSEVERLQRRQKMLESELEAIESNPEAHMAFLMYKSKDFSTIKDDELRVTLMELNLRLQKIESRRKELLLQLSNEDMKKYSLNPNNGIDKK